MRELKLKMDNKNGSPNPGHKTRPSCNKKEETIISAIGLCSNRVKIKKNKKICQIPGPC